MKPWTSIGIVFLLALVFQPARAQTSILDSEVRFREQTVTIHFMLSAMETTGGFTFSYGREVPVERIYHVTEGKRSVREHLEDMFKDDSLTYVEKGNKILIVPPSKPPKEKPKQTVKGRILDLDTKLPLVGANVLLGSEEPEEGTTTDESGYFRFNDVQVGRHNIQCSYIGYESKTLSNFQVTSGKEFVANLEMEESVYAISEVKITSRKERSLPINELSVVSGRSFSAYEVENYPGSLSDISRAAVSFPGVVSTNDGQNHIVIRGNSPKGLQWRLEGIEIPNLNHFSDIGASGGGVNVVSNNMLANSDFLTGAFPSEYGNALSGVFDLRLRSGNNEKHETTFQIGLLGTEAMIEGPINKKTNTTYIAQYRYSTLKIIQKFGVNLQSVPDFQDLSFKIYHPTKKLGVFTLFGIGGLSHETGASGYEQNSDMATVGITNSLTVNPKTHLRTVLAVSGRTYTWDSDVNIGTAESPINRIWTTNIADYTAKGSFVVNRKISNRHKLKAGIIYEMAWNDSHMSWYSDTLFNWFSDPVNPAYQIQNYEHIYVDGSEHAGTLQAFANWRYRIGETFTVNTGMHFIQFYLNNNFSVEPRLGLQWNLHPRHTISAGFGIHSRKESMTLYTGEFTLHDGVVINPNMDLELSKARHYVLAYNYRMGQHMHLKTEAYYQDLYDIPAYPFPPYFSTQNFDFGFEGNILTNYGSGYNTGFEVSLERYMTNGFHFMLNGTIYDSKYENKLGELLNSKYNGSYASNGLIGKEFKIGSGKQHTFGISSRYIFAGGMRYLPIDREASIATRSTVRLWDNGFSEKVSDYFRIDLMIKFRRNRPRYTGEWTVDLLNVLNRQNMRTEYWDNNIDDFYAEYQNPFLLFLTYRIQF
ncbi:MAG: TonB-dependent receptor [Bacteroidales bacterium]|nr:TonB-dependent receptor [Bacteroidales bacterium]